MLILDILEYFVTGNNKTRLCYVSEGLILQTERPPNAGVPDGTFLNRLDRFLLVRHLSRGSKAKR